MVLLTTLSNALRRSGTADFTKNDFLEVPSNRFGHVLSVPLSSLVLILCISSFSQDFQVKATVNPSQIHIGDRFQYHIEVNAPESLAVDLPGLVGNLGSFEVKDMKVSDAKAGAGRKLRTWDLSLSTFIGGDFVLPPQAVEAWKGKDTLRTYTEPVPVRVLTRVTDKDEDILDVEAPIADPHTPWWVWVLVGIVGAVALFFLVKFLIKSLRKAATIPDLPPYEEAVLALSQLRSRTLIPQGNQAEHFFLAGQILRRFVHRQFQADVLDATTSELKERITTISGIPDHWLNSWVEFSQETDMVKFAKSTLPEEDCFRLERFADSFLFENRPVAQAKPTEAK